MTVTDVKTLVIFNLQNKADFATACYSSVLKFSMSIIVLRSWHDGPKVRVILGTLSSLIFKYPTIIIIGLLCTTHDLQSLSLNSFIISLRTFIYYVLLGKW